MVEHYPIFTDEDALELTEHAQHPRLMPAISTGCTLSMLHARGLIHGDLHGGNSLFDWYTGVAGFVDVNEQEGRELSPDRMAVDFLVPRVSMGFAWCQALLAGYVKIGRLSIDPICPGYCDDLLDFLGGSVDSDPRPRTPTLPADTLDDALVWLDSELLPGYHPDRFWLSSTTPTQCTFMIGGLLSAGVDCTALISRPSGDTRGPGHEMIRNLVNSLINRQTAPTSCPAEVPKVGWDFLTVSLSARTAIAQRVVGSRVKPDTQIFHTINQLRNTYPQRDLEEMLCAFTDVCDWLAARADHGTGRAVNDLSVQSAQLTYMLLQLISKPGIVESAELTAARRHALLSWYPALIDGQREASDQDLLYLFAYANSRVSTYRRMFEGEDPSPDHGRPWTANWRAISMSRTWLLKLLARRRADRAPHESTELLDQAISIAANGLGAILNHHAQITLLLLAPEYMMMSPQSKKQSRFERLGEEIDALAELLKLARSRQPDAPVTSDYATLGIQYLKRYSGLSSVPFDDEIAR
jgi:hypothetical protein